eukprot:TRINITY_DN4027_c0_g1_i1.p1 TRINITY_DN4027_c0_g1~~TRINITY_DN4027_c0_g1_i1.p1  ORF type:complete len:437 (-),score=153.89 TRINITY_DN4027_c0_g1_i1:51-1361(-)
MKRNIRSKKPEEESARAGKATGVTKARSPERVPAPILPSPKHGKKTVNDENVERPRNFVGVTSQKDTSQITQKSWSGSNMGQVQEEPEACDPDVIRRILLEQKLDEMGEEFERIHALTFEKERELQKMRDGMTMFEAKVHAELQQYNHLLNERNQRLLEAYERIAHLEAVISGKGVDDETAARDKIRLEEAEKRVELITEEAKAAKAHAASLEKKFAGSTHEVEDLQKRVLDAHRLIASTREENERLREELNAQIAAVRDEENLRSQLEDAVGESKVLKATIQRLTTEIAMCEREKSELISRCDTLSNHAEVLRREQMEAERRINSTHAFTNTPSNTAQTSSRDLERINAMLLDENINLKLTIASLKKDNDTLRQSALNKTVETPYSAFLEDSQAAGKRIASPSREEVEYYREVIIDLEGKVRLLLAQNERLNDLL